MSYAVDTYMLCFSQEKYRGKKNQINENFFLRFFDFLLFCLGLFFLTTAKTNPITSYAIFFSHFILSFFLKVKCQGINIPDCIQVGHENIKKHPSLLSRNTKEALPEHFHKGPCRAICTLELLLICFDLRANTLGSPVSYLFFTQKRQ